MFTSPIQDLNVNAIETTVHGVAPGSQGKVTGDLQITMVHKPENT